MFNNGTFGNYNPQFQNPYMDRLNAMQNFNTPRMEITRVNGKNGAEAFPLAPNSSALLLDENAPIVWLTQSDGAGYKTITPYTITPYEAEKPTDNFAILEQRITKLEAILNEQSNTKSDAKSKPSKDSK